MTNKFLFIVVILLSIGVVISFKIKDETNFFDSKNIKIKVKDDDTSSISKYNLEDYIVGVVAAEMPASYEEEALKAQAIAARSYALYKINNSNKDYDVLTNISDQSFINIEQMKIKWGDDFQYYYNRIKNVVDETKNMIMMYNGKVIEAFYFAMSNGYTEDAKSVFNQDFPYLVSKKSSWEDENLKNFIVSKCYSLTHFANLLDLQLPLYINEIDRSDTNRVNKIVINNQEILGTNFRKKLGLRSTDFEIKISDQVCITTKGYGHGVGMSQNGANLMAKNGYNYDEILNYYYSDINISYIEV